MADSNDTITYHMTDEQLDAFAKRCVAEFAGSHLCVHSQYNQHLKAFGQACEEHEIKPGDLMVMVFSAKTATSLVKRAAAGFLLCLAIVVIYVFSGEWIRGMMK